MGSAQNDCRGLFNEPSSAVWPSIDDPQKVVVKHAHRAIVIGIIVNAARLHHRQRQITKQLLNLPLAASAPEQEGVLRKQD